MFYHEENIKSCILINEIISKRIFLVKYIAHFNTIMLLGTIFQSLKHNKKTYEKFVLVVIYAQALTIHKTVNKLIFM